MMVERHDPCFMGLLLPLFLSAKKTTFFSGDAYQQKVLFFTERGMVISYFLRLMMNLLMAFRTGFVPFGRLVLPGYGMTTFCTTFTTTMRVTGWGSSLYDEQLVFDPTIESDRLYQQLGCCDQGFQLDHCCLTVAMNITKFAALAPEKYVFLFLRHHLCRSTC